VHEHPPTCNSDGKVVIHGKMLARCRPKQVALQSIEASELPDSGRRKGARLCRQNPPDQSFCCPTIMAVREEGLMVHNSCDREKNRGKKEKDLLVSVRYRTICQVIVRG
jgi:hypothetical protein